MPTVRNLSDLKRSYEVPVENNVRSPLNRTTPTDVSGPGTPRCGLVAAFTLPADLLEAGWLGTEVTITPGANRGLAQRTTRILFWVAPHSRA